MLEVGGGALLDRGMEKASRHNNGTTCYGIDVDGEPDPPSTSAITNDYRTVKKDESEKAWRPRRKSELQFRGGITGRKTASLKISRAFSFEAVVRSLMN